MECDIIIPPFQGFVAAWFWVGMMDAGSGPFMGLATGPPWLFRVWVRLTEIPVAASRPLQKLRGPQPDTEDGMRRVWAESRASMAPLGGHFGVEERRLLRRLLASTAIVVQDIMTKWPKVQGAAPDDRRDALLKTFRASGHSRLPVRDDSGVVGLVHVKDALTAGPEATTADLMRPPYFVRRASVIQEVLDSLRQAREHLAVVVDELGRPVGVVTIEDILEELVGELYDEREAPREGRP